jgi:DHA1 family bicyclomycin/chloramphenicol resistance-like MFS transporter
MSMNLFSMKRLTNTNAPILFKAGLRIQIAGIASMAVAVLAGLDSMWVMVPLIVVTMSTLGLVGPAGSSQYMSFFTNLAGSASSVYTTLMFSLGGVFGALVGLFYDGSLLPLVGVIAFASIVANVLLLTLPKYAPSTAVDRG